MKETIISSGRDRSLNHNVVWARIDSTGGRYAYRVHPHGVKGRKVASEDMGRENGQMKKSVGAKASEVKLGSLRFGETYTNENFTTKVHGETDGTRHVVRGAKKTRVIISPPSLSF